MLPVVTGATEASAPRRLLFPMVSVDPGNPERRSSVYYGPPFDGVAKQTPMVSVVDPDLRQSLSKYVLGTTEKTYARECLLPRAAALRVHGKTPSLPGRPPAARSARFTRASLRNEAKISPSVGCVHSTFMVSDGTTSARG